MTTERETVICPHGKFSRDECQLCLLNVDTVWLVRFAGVVRKAKVKKVFVKCVELQLDQLGLDDGIYELGKDVELIERIEP